MKIQTLHPDPDKQNANIDRDKYLRIKSSIENVLEQHGPISFKELNQLVKEEVTNFDGSISWYITTVKLDLEAREIIQVDRSSSPQMIKLG